MRLGGEKVLNVRFCFFKKERHTQRERGGVTLRQKERAEGKVIKCQHLINLLYYFLYLSVALKDFMKNVQKGQECIRLLMVTFLEEKKYRTKEIKARVVEKKAEPETDMEKPQGILFERHLPPQAQLVSDQKPDHFLSPAGPTPLGPWPRPSLSQPGRRELGWCSVACSGPRNHLCTRLTRSPAIATPATSKGEGTPLQRRDTERGAHSLGFENWWRASLVAQWLGVCLPMQGTRVRALAWEDPTCRGATKPVSHNY